MGTVFAGIPSQYIISHPGQLSLLHSVGWEMGTGQNALMICGWEVKAVVAHFSRALNVWLAGKTV